MIVTQLSYLARTLKLSQVIALWMRIEEYIWNFDVTLGAGLGCVAPMGQNLFCTNIIMLHIKSKVMKNRIQWCKTFAPEACLESLDVKKLDFGSFFLYCNPTPRRLF